MSPIISIIVACYNGEKFITKTIRHVLNSTFRKFELIIIDDCSSDRSRSILKTYRNKNLKIIFSKKNIGLGSSNNKGAQIAKGEILLFLNQDCFLNKNCLTEIVHFYKIHPQAGAGQIKLLRDKNKQIDTVGHFISKVGLPYDPYHNKSHSRFTKEQKILGVRNTAFAIKKTAFSESGGFDRNYFIYGEDTDLSWRLWNFGYDNFFIPKAYGMHQERSSMETQNSDYLLYEGSKNNINAVIKNTLFPQIIALLPLNILSWIAISIRLLSSMKIHQSLLILRGIIWNMTHIVKTLKKRDSIMKHTARSNDSFIYGPISYFALLKKAIKWNAHL